MDKRKKQDYNSRRRRGGWGIQEHVTRLIDTITEKLKSQQTTTTTTREREVEDKREIVAMNQRAGDLTKFARDKQERHSLRVSVLFLFMFFYQLLLYRIGTKKGRVTESCVS